MQLEAQRIARGLYNGTINAGEISAAMTKLVADELFKAVVDGFGKDFPAIDYATPDYNMLIQLEKNCFHFSGAKNYQMLKSMSLALRDENGKTRTFKDFKEEATKISDSYLGSHLRTEYDTAIGSAQMAGKWVDFEQNEEAAPYLRYDTVGDARVRPAHKELDGVIKRVKDPFWNVYYPPNGWRCRCDVTQLLHGAETPTHSISLPDDVPPIFQTNMAKDGLAFPPNHPYYVDMPAHLLRKAEALKDSHFSKVTRTKSMQGDVWVNDQADPKDLAQNIQFSKRLAEFGETVKIMPHEPAVQKAKSPEILIGSAAADFKANINTALHKFVKNSINSANDQKCMPVIVLPGNIYNRDEVWRGLRADLSNPERKKSISHVWLMLDKELVKIKRGDLLKAKENFLP